MKLGSIGYPLERGGHGSDADYSLESRTGVCGRLEADARSLPSSSVFASASAPLNSFTPTVVFVSFVSARVARWHGGYGAELWSRVRLLAAALSGAALGKSFTRMCLSHQAA